LEVSKKYVTEGVEYTVLRSARRTVAIEVTVGGDVIVRLPHRFSEKNIPQVIIGHKEWILKKIEKQKALPKRKEYSKEEKAALKEKAKEILPPLINKYSGLMGLYPSAVKIGFAKTRFGSCSGKNSINFSAYLMEYEKEAIEYVVVHELAHIKHHNHSKQFYKLIERYMPDYKIRAKLLKR
jgi:predicted metal-dependent hydrolase